jgi:prepilin peptidase CpaA
VEVLATMVLAWSAAYIDYRTFKIPNWLTVSSILLGFSIHFFESGLTGILQALAGLSTGLLLMLPGYLLQATAAGDVKLMAALGTLLGPSRILNALLYTIFVAGIVGLAMALVAWRSRGATTPFKRYGKILRCLIATGRFIYIQPLAGEAMAKRMPLAVPIAIGTTGSLLFPPNFLW